MAQSGWLLSAFLVVGCSLPVSDFSASSGDASSTDTAVDETAADSTAADSDMDSTSGDVGFVDTTPTELCPGKVKCDVDGGTYYCSDLKDSENCGACGKKCMAPTPFCRGTTCKAM